MKRRRATLLVFLPALWLGCASAQLPPPGEPLSNRARVVYEAPTSFGRLFVVDEDGLRFLRFDSPDGDDQSAVSLTDPGAVPFEYVRIAALATVIPERCSRLLMIGLGGGSFTTLLRRMLPGLEIDAVEVDEVVARVARDYFGVREDDAFRIHVSDGLAFLERAGTYDVIFVDAYSGDGLPAHLSTPAFFSLVRAHLQPAGVAVVNLALEPEQEAEVVASFTAAFPEPACLPTEDGLNSILFGRADASLPSAAELGARSTGIAWPFAAAPLAARLDAECAAR